MKRSVVVPFVMTLVFAVLAAACSTNGVYVAEPDAGQAPTESIGPADSHPDNNDAAQSDPAPPERSENTDRVPENNNSNTDDDAAPADDNGSRTEPSAPLAPASFSVGECTADATQQSLTAAGKTMWEPQGQPNYLVRAVLEPDGRLVGTMSVDLTANDATTDFRVFPLVFRDSDFRAAATVDGDAVDMAIEGSLLSVPASPGSTNTVLIDFSYQLPAAPTGSLLDMSGGALAPEDIGLLAQGSDVVSLGHWFPLLIADGANNAPFLNGMGDVSNFPAADMCVELVIPAGWQAVGGGVVLVDEEIANGTRHVEVGAGVRDLAMALLREPEFASAEADGVTVNVWGRPGDPVEEVLAESVASVEALTDAFGVYPWAELDVVSTPLGSGVGGMEWPAMMWIEQSIFAGGLPGMGDLGDLGAIFGDEDLSVLFGDDELGDMFEELFGGEGMADIFGDVPGMGAIATMREWTVAHEVGHMWWHALVGNDSTLAPALDEPLAQYSACVVMEHVYGAAEAQPICLAHTAEAYQSTKMLGFNDDAADQATADFDNSYQYGAVVYGKAPIFYFELRDILGVDGTNSALAGFVQKYAFEEATTDDLQRWLVDSAGPDGDAVNDLWIRWIEEAHGDRDIG